MLANLLLWLINRVEDIIERYRSEFILDNLRLVEPFTLVRAKIHSSKIGLNLMHVHVYVSINIMLVKWH